MKEVKKVAILTAGGLAPCLSSAIGGLIEQYSKIAPKVKIICYTSGYKGLLLENPLPSPRLSALKRPSCTSTAAARSATAA